MDTRARLVAWLIRNNMTQSNLSRRLGYSLNYVNMIVHGRRPICDSFKWRFATEFGQDEAARLFANNKEHSNENHND